MYAFLFDSQHMYFLCIALRYTVSVLSTKRRTVMLMHTNHISVFLRIYYMQRSRCFMGCDAVMLFVLCVIEHFNKLDKITKKETNWNLLLSMFLIP